MKRGFTMIELLIAVGIVSMLLAMAMPMYGVVRHMMKRTATEYVLKRTDTALRLFKADWGIYPCQAVYPEPFTGAGFPNRLFYQVGSDIDPDQADRVRADMATAALQYDEANAASTIKYTSADMSPLFSGTHAIQLNRSAREQVRLAVLAGNLTMRGPVITHMTAAGTLTVKADRSGTRVLASPTSDTAGVGPGWAADYLAGELEAAFRDGQSIRDAWGRPLVYINQSVPGVTTGNTRVSGTEMWQNNAPRNYDMALGPIGFEVDTSVPGLAQTLKTANRQRLFYWGRIRLDERNAGDGQPVPTSASDPLLPYPGRLLQSDMRYWCLHGYEVEFELWSAGRDGRFSYIRDAAENADNVAVVPFNKAKL